jgi:arylsulfatase A-like enzyme
MGAGAGAAAPRSAGAAAPASTTPTRVVIIVVDALRKDFVTRYGMTNIQSLMAQGTNFENSYLGHMGSETVVSHNVITSGMLPKHMGWTDEGYRDVDDVLDPGDTEPNDFYLPGDLSKDQIYALQAHAGYPKLQDYLHSRFPGKKVATISPKRYAAWTYGGSTSDITVTFGGRPACPAQGNAPTRVPDGVNVPSYIMNGGDCAGRYYVNGNRNSFYDTDVLPARLYPLDGNRYTVGHDPAHQGGDVWAADAAIDIMSHEDWSGIFVTLPGVDKAAHMWGAEGDPGAASSTHYDPMTHMAAATKVADEQVGRIINSLRDSGQLSQTLVVVTADHGMNAGGMNFLGDTRDAAAGFPNDSRGFYNWYYADTPPGLVDYLDPSAWVAPLVATGNIGISYQDSAIRIWLKDQSDAKVTEATNIVSGMSGVLATYRRQGEHYQLVWNRPPEQLTSAEWSWFQLHGQEIVDTSAARYGADVIGLLRDHTVAGVVGDHGGAQFAAQNIPIVFYGAGTTTLDSAAPMRSVDIMPTVLRALGIPLTQPTDGVGYPLPDGVLTGTVTKVNAPNRKVRVDHVARIRVHVHPTSGNVQPTGSVKVVIRNKKHDRVYRQTKVYTGGKLVFISPELHKWGKYTVTAKYMPPAGSPFNASRDKDTFHVVVAN